jgi:hypothetical protein
VTTFAKQGNNEDRPREQKESKRYRDDHHNYGTG